MKFSYLLVAVLLVSSVYSQTFVNRIIIDNFLEGPQNIVVSLTGTVSPGSPVVEFDIYTAPGNTSNILGGERDLEVTITQGSSGKIITAQVFATEGNFQVSTPQGAAAVDLLQYDGKDGSTTLDTSGIAATLRDLTDGGQALGITFNLLTDITTNYDFFFFDTAGGTCQFTQDILPNTEFASFQIPFSSIPGNCDFTDIGAIEFQVDGANNVDTIIQFFGVYGVVDSPPSPPATPQPPGGFTWYTFDDDDNGRSPCSSEPDRRTYFLDDNEIIYYYFYGFEYEKPESSDAAVNVISTVAVLSMAVLAAFF